MNTDFKSILQKALNSVLENPESNSIYKGLLDQVDFSILDAFLDESQTPIELVLSKAAIIAAREAAGPNKRARRATLDFFDNTQRKRNELIYTFNSSVEWYLRPETVLESVRSANLAIELIHDLSLLYGIELFQLLGLRNLSAFVGEVLAKQVAREEKTRLMPNPNQDGYPDLCVLSPEGKKYLDDNAHADGKTRSDKSLWSPYPFGGIEVKATCGNTPPASKMRKPLIGESRLPTMVSAEWKAHHQETRVLLAILWDFVDGLPTVLAAFFRNDLDTTIGVSNKDWGAIIRPVDGGGRTTSVSIMKRGRTNREGVRKMGHGWMVLPSDPKLLQAIEKVFGLELNANKVL